MSDEEHSDSEFYYPEEQETANLDRSVFTVKYQTSALLY